MVCEWQVDNFVCAEIWPWSLRFKDVQCMRGQRLLHTVIVMNTKAGYSKGKLKLDVIVSNIYLIEQ